MKENFQTLYIIGNGFDLHHGLKTSYNDFKDFLEKESARKRYKSVNEKFKNCCATNNVNSLIQKFKLYSDKKKEIFTYHNTIEEIMIDPSLSISTDRLFTKVQ
ncbi:MAG: hypothetical protein IKO42_02815 [Opitutales bacterium]|nr:hypothetical protein [Opitutales bacterium]